MEQYIKIYLKNKIDEKVLNDTLIKIGLISIEIKNGYLKSLDRGGIFSFIADSFANIADNIIDNIPDDTAKTTVSPLGYSQVSQQALFPITGELYFSSRTYYKFSLTDKINLSTIADDFFIGSHIRLDAEESCIYICDYNGNIISGMKKMLFREKILDEVYDKSKEYENNLEKYEANTDDIIDRIEKLKETYEGSIEKYKMFIIKHFIKFVMDKDKEYKEISKIFDKFAEREKEKFEKLNPIIKQCENKINEIKEIIKDFDYSDKKTYEEATSKIEKDLEELENKDISVSRVNEIIDEINETYRNAYKKKNNVSALSYIMETDEDIDLIKKIDIDNL